MYSLDEYAKPILALLLILVVIAMLGFLKFESGEGSASYVKAEIISYSRQSTGKSSPDPAFYAELPSGVGVFVRDWGEIPATYRGPVILELQKGQLSGKAIYKIDVERTSRLLND
ncbi:hypothetical protein BST95_02610 [Halioglobus japonicus]|uniref:Uncharacterized protein n=1 Tax=Halioglobus japonicus TaxID=930805 RepID=A0AAP8SLD9_9GAMM|nr:hypothetical protein [Halioglobus japonicus]AQA17278.1 hypothetical protein BST95_02610 [Halioglobus japonicus]PLW84509.1 hypothetical protein C0029_18840 [Halioglobus japonicus]GHD24527.1 hypothetical protein GCM10007052_38170 [Halioglobus japonicus]